MHDANWISHFMSTKLSPAVTPDLSDSDREQMERVLTAVLAALRPHPEARAAVVAGFEALDLSDLENAKTTKRTQEVIDNKAGTLSGTAFEPRVVPRLTSPGSIPLRKQKNKKRAQEVVENTVEDAGYQ